MIESVIYGVLTAQILTVGRSTPIIGLPIGVDRQNVRFRAILLQAVPN